MICVAQIRPHMGSEGHVRCYIPHPHPDQEHEGMLEDEFGNRTVIYWQILEYKNEERSE